MSINISDLTNKVTPDNTDLLHLREVSGIGKKITYANLLAALKADILDDTFPIGMLYVQFPGKDSPADMNWPGTWTNKSSDFAGDFFRAEGGHASAFESGEQSYAIKTHKHNLTVEYKNGDGAYAVVRRTGAASGGATVTKATGNPTGATTNANEGRPVNKTIRIWERTA